MADLSITFAGIRSPNPFWLASAPPSNSSFPNLPKIYAVGECIRVKGAASKVMAAQDGKLAAQSIAGALHG